MGKNDVNIKVSISGKVGAAYGRVKKAIQGHNKAIRQSFNKAAMAAKKFAFSMKGLAVAAGGLIIFNKVNALIKESIGLFDKQATAEAQLRTALGRTSKALLQQAADLQKVTRFGDEETIQAQGLIAAFVKEEEQIKKVIPLVQVWF